MESYGMMAEGQQGPETQSKWLKPARHFRKMPFKTTFVPTSGPLLDSQLELIFNMAETSVRNNNTGWWAHCCFGVVRNIDCKVLGHPHNQVESLRKLFQTNRLTNLETFKQYMLTTLPRNDVGLVLLPQINMEHPGEIKVKIEEDAAEPDVKMEEERLEEVQWKQQKEELLQSIMAKQAEQDAKQDRMFKKMLEIHVQQQQLLLKVEGMEESIEDLLKKEDDRDILISNTRDQVEALRTAVHNTRRQMQELDFKVTVLVDDSKVTRPAINRQIAAGLSVLSRPENEPKQPF